MDQLDLEIYYDQFDLLIVEIRVGGATGVLRTSYNLLSVFSLLF